jgi:DNA-binding NtrC family response regulator
MPVPNVLVVDDDPLQRWAVREQLQAWGYVVIEADGAATALATYRAESPDLVLLDLRLGEDSGLDVLKDIRALDPSAAVIMITAHGAVDEAVNGFRLGLTDFFRKPIDFNALRVAIRYRLDAQRLREGVERERRDRSQEAAIVGNSEAISTAVRMLEKVAASEATTVLLQGESGTGKDLFAKALHDRSSRRTGPFIAVNCAALPDALLESELFGHERGAFTDARALKKGVIELADGGTLYLDEIGELKLPLQAKLLRVLETMTFRRIGGLRDITVDTRVIAASNRDLDHAVKVGEFRSDLFYRLGAIQIQLPPLRDRREDIPVLAEHLVHLLAVKLRRRPIALTPEATACLCRYAWPGNIRELRNALERAIILEEGERITTRYLPAAVVAESAADIVVPSRFTLPPSGVSLEGVEEDLVRQAMRLSEGNQSKAARLLNISRDALRYKLKKLSLLGHDHDEADS